MDINQIKSIKTRRHDKLSDKEEIWTLIQESYKGGLDYINKVNLFRYHTESKISYAGRLKRAYYYNLVQPLVELLVGFLYNVPPSRDGIDKTLLGQCSKNKDLQSFMEGIAIHGFMYTVGILIDSPHFIEPMSEATRAEFNVNPYALMYMPSRIRDFEKIDGQLNWILLDDSYYDNTDPFSAPQNVTKYTLWDLDSITTFRFDNKNLANTQIIERVNHIDEVPFIFVNSRDDNHDSITESIFEDVAIICRHIFNTLSVIDENIQSASFKSLFFPVESEDEIPKEIRTKGIGGLAVIPYLVHGSEKPYFAGVDISNIQDMTTILDRDIRMIRNSVGLSNDEQKNWVQSGKAKSVEFQKCESLLRVFSTQLENTEREMARLWGKYTGNPDKSVIEYTKEFQGESVSAKLERLIKVYELNIPEYKGATEKIIKLVEGE